MYTVTNSPTTKINIPVVTIPKVTPNIPAINPPQPPKVNIDAVQPANVPIIPAVAPIATTLPVIPPLFVDLLVLHQLRLIISRNRFQYKWKQLMKTLILYKYTLQTYEQYGIPTRYIVMLGLHGMNIVQWTNDILTKVNTQPRNHKRELETWGYSSVSELQLDVDDPALINYTKPNQDHFGFKGEILGPIMDKILVLEQDRFNVTNTEFKHRLHTICDDVNITEDELQAYDIPLRYIAELGLYGISMEEWLLEQTYNDEIFGDDLAMLGYDTMKEIRN
jgi:hypothetical protein